MTPCQRFVPSLLGLLLAFSGTLLARIPETISSGPLRAEASACIAPRAHAALLERVRRLQRRHEDDDRGTPTDKAPPLFVSPMARLGHAPGFANWAISNYVDHDAEFPRHILDFEGGERSYDLESGYNHRGTDFVLWPFWWQQMADEVVAVVAAAPGRIVLKQDGFADQNCETGGSGLDWNLIVVEHADGSVAWYGHLKRGTLTEKDINAWVRQGEFLAYPGSSGNSSAPHLHFEVYDRQSNLIDPFAGPFNTTSPTSWWQDQEPYLMPSVLRLMTHHRAPKLGCVDREEVNAHEYFQPGMAVFAGAYLRDQLGTLPVDFSLKDPSGDVYESWDNLLTTDHVSTSFWYWKRVLEPDAAPGIYTFEARLDDLLYRDYFSVGDLPVPEITFSSGSDGAVPPGNPVDLAWDTKYATRVVIEPDVGEVDIRGSLTLQAWETVERTLVATGPGGEMRQAFSVRVDTGDPVRLVGHVTRERSGFTTKFIVSNRSDETQTYRILAYDTEGQAFPPFQATIGGGLTLTLEKEALLTEDPVSHFVIQAPDSVSFVAAYQSTEAGSPAHVREKSDFASSWRLYPGDWERVWDGLAIVNMDAQPANMTVELKDQGGNLRATFSPERLQGLAPMAKALIVLGDLEVRPNPGDYFTLTSDRLVAVTALRGDAKDNRFLWENLAIRE